MEDYDSKEAKKAHMEAIQALIMAEVMTGGTFLESLLPKPKPRPREICPGCRNNRSGSEHICRGATKTLAKGTEIVIVSCSGFEGNPEVEQKEIREGAPDSFSKTGGNG